MKPHLLLARSFLSLCMFTAPIMGATTANLMISHTAHAAALSPTTPLKLKSVKIEGNKAVATQEILQAFGYHAGDQVSQVDLKGAQDRIGQLYSQHNVGGSFGQELRIAGSSVTVTVKITEQAAPPAPTNQQLVLDSVIFKGNSAVSSDILAQVTHLRAGGSVSDQAVVQDESAIQAAYSKTNVSAKIQPIATYPNHDNHVVLTWQIDESR